MRNKIQGLIVELIKNGIICILMLGLLISTMPMTALAQTSSKEKIDVKISTERELKNFFLNLSSGTTYAGKTIKVTKDIKVKSNGVGDFDLITPFATFSGIFDGGCHTISGISSWSTQYGADGSLFGKIETSGVVKNLYIEDFYFNNTSTSEICIIAYSNHGVIDNCRISNCDLNSKGAYGLVDENAGEIRNCTVEGTLTSSGVFVSGLARYNMGKISNCSFVGTLSVSPTVQYKGGLVCLNPNIQGIFGTIQNCYSLVKGSDNKIYGICNEMNGAALNCFYADDNVISAFKKSSGSIDNINSYSTEEMSRKSFAKELNQKLPSNGYKWEIAGETYPTLIDLYEVTFKSLDSNKGVIKSNKSYASKGQKVKLTSSINKKYKLMSVTVKTSNGKSVKLKKISNGTYQFIMPQDTVVVTANIVKK